MLNYPAGNAINRRDAQLERLFLTHETPKLDVSTKYHHTTLGSACIILEEYLNARNCAAEFSNTHILDAINRISTANIN